MSTRLAAVCAVLIALSATAQQATDTAIATQPVRTLDGDAGAVALDPVHGGILVIAFSREANPQAQEWSAQLRAALDQRGQGLPLANIVVLAGAPRLIRGLVRRAIRGSIPEEQQSTFYIVDADDAFWRALAAADDENVAYVLRVDSTDRVCGRQAGPVTQEALAGILDAPCPAADGGS